MPDKSEALLSEPKTIEQFVWNEVEDHVTGPDPAYRNLPTGEITDTIVQIAAAAHGLTEARIRGLVTAAIAWWLGVYDSIHEGIDQPSISEAIRDAWSRGLDQNKA